MKLKGFIVKCCFLSCVFIGGVLYTGEIPWYQGHSAISYNKSVYAVVIDAGITGSKVLAYTFHETDLDGLLVLDKELVEFNKPGLSSFAKEPDKGAQKIAELLEKAKKEIPKEHWSKTPIIMKATAGLRLLPPEDADKLLDAVKNLFKKTSFKGNDISVEIMDRTDENIFSWLTLIFLLDRFKGSSAQTVAALDLGEHSTEVTFAADKPESLKEKKDIHKAASRTVDIPIYTHSYLGLGLMSARRAVITFGQGGATNVTSECVNPTIKNKRFFFHGKEYIVSGLHKDYPTYINTVWANIIDDIFPIVNFSRCADIILSYVSHVINQTKPPDEFPTKNIYAFSYDYDRASDVALIDNLTGGRVRIHEFKTEAEKACLEPNVEQPFICLDLTFIWLLLEKGFELDQDTTIYLYKKVNGHEISWPLGAAYDALRGSSRGVSFKMQNYEVSRYCAITAQLLSVKEELISSSSKNDSDSDIEVVAILIRKFKKKPQRIDTYVEFILENIMGKQYQEHFRITVDKYETVVIFLLT